MRRFWALAVASVSFTRGSLAPRPSVSIREPSFSPFESSRAAEAARASDSAWLSGNFSVLDSLSASVWPTIWMRQTSGSSDFAIAAMNGTWSGLSWSEPGLNRPPMRVVMRMRGPIGSTATVPAVISSASAERMRCSREEVTTGGWTTGGGVLRSMTSGAAGS